MRWTSLLPKYSFLFVYFYSGMKVIFRTHLFHFFSFPFTLKRKTHPVSFRNERHILFHSETKDTSYTPTIPFLSFKIIHFESEKFHIFSFILLMSYMCWKPKLYPSCSLVFHLVFHFEAKDTPSPIDQLPLSIHFDSKRELINATIFFRWALQVVKTQLIPRLYPPSKNTIYTPAIPPPPRKNRTSLINKRLPMNDLIFYFRFIS